MTAPVPLRPGRHVRAPHRPTWRRRADSLLAAGLAGLLVVSAVAVVLVKVDVIGTGTAVAQPGRVLVVLTGSDAAAVREGGRVSVVWTAEGHRADGTVGRVDGPAPGRDLAARYDLPVQLTGDGIDTVVAEARFDSPPGGAIGPATTYLGHRSLFRLFIGQGVER